MEEVPVRSPNGARLQKAAGPDDVVRQPAIPRAGGRGVPKAQTRLTRTRGGGQPRRSSRFSGAGGSAATKGNPGTVLLDPSTSAKLSALYGGAHEGLLMANQGKLGSPESVLRIFAAGLLGYAGGRGGNMINRRFADSGVGACLAANTGLGATTGFAGGGTAAVISGEPVGAGMLWGTIGGGLSGLLGAGGGELMSAGAGRMQNQTLSDLGQGLAVSAGSSGSLLADYFAGRGGQQKQPKADPYTWKDLHEDMNKLPLIMRGQT